MGTKESHGSKQQTRTSRIDGAETETAVVNDTTAALNESTIVGRLVAEPEFRDLPSGVVAASFSLTVRAPGEKTTSVPIVWYDPPKRLNSWAVDETAVVRGAVVRRFFQTGGGLGSSTEVVVRNAELWRHRAKAAAVLTKSVRSVESAVS